MDFFEQGKKDLTQETEMEILQKQKHEQVFIGSMKKVSGHTMFSYNTVTKEIKVAPVSERRWLIIAHELLSIRSLSLLRRIVYIIKPSTRRTLSKY